MKLKIFTFILLFCSFSACYAQSGQISGISLQNVNGYAKVQPNTSVYLCSYNAQLVCATPSGEAGMYSDPGLTQLVTQPLLSDVNGHYNYYVNTGTLYLEKDCFTAYVCQTYPVYLSPSNIGGTCSMSSSTTCSVSLSKSYNTPICIVTPQGSTPHAGSCTVSGATATVTASSSNSSVWGVLVFGNPN